jgi:nitronate monooxygenase
MSGVLFDLRARLEVPVIAAPMFLVSGTELVVAAARAGIVGAFPAPNARTLDDLDAWCSRIVDETADARGSWAIGIVAHRTYPRLAAEIELIATHRPPLVITALGSPSAVVDVVHGYGGVVLADVTTLRHAERALAAGVDGLVLVCAGAGGHTGTHNPFAFVCAIRAGFSGPLVLAGGVADGAGVAGAVAAGADLAYVGSRFIATRESLVVEEYRQMVVDSGLDDLEISAAVTGAPAVWLKPSLHAAGGTSAAARPDFSQIHGDDRRRWRDVWSAGQGIAGAWAVADVATVVEELAGGYAAALGRLVPEGVKA